MDRIMLEGMEFFTPHGGVHPAVRELGIKLTVNLVLEVDTTDAIRSDQLEDTADVDDVYELVREVIDAKPWRLLESLGARIGDRLVGMERVHRATVTVHRHANHRVAFRSYGVEVTRAR